MQYKVNGTVMPTLDITLQAGETVFTERGSIAWMSGKIKMDASTQGGLLKGLGLTTYRCESGQAMITFSPKAPGTILPFELTAGQSLICQKDAFMCAQESVNVEMHSRKKLGGGLFGGEGFILQKITGPGVAFMEITGKVREYDLQAGQQMKINPGHIALFEPSVKYELEQVKGVKNIFFGGEGLFLAKLTGPGHIWLQSMPLSNLAAAIQTMLPSGQQANQ